MPYKIHILLMFYDMYNVQEVSILIFLKNNRIVNYCDIIMLSYYIMHLLCMVYYKLFLPNKVLQALIFQGQRR